MASREHWSDRRRTHVKVSTIHTDIAGAFVEWGIEAWRERKHRLQVEWWNPFTWGAYEWRREGAPPEIVRVQFLRGDGTEIPQDLLNPAVTSHPGYRRIRAIYVFVSVGTGSGLSNLGNDARSVTNVKVTYLWQGAEKTLAHHS